MKNPFKNMLLKAQEIMPKSRKNISEDIEDMIFDYYLAEKYTSKADETFKNLQSNIRLGATSNDSIKDFVILNHNVKPITSAIFEEEEKNYRTIDKKVSDNIGKVVLIVDKKEVISGLIGSRSPYFIDPMFLKIETKYTLGIISGPLEFNATKGNMVFPTLNNYIQHSYRASVNSWEEKNGNIIISYEDFKDLDKTISKRTVPLMNNVFIPIIELKDANKTRSARTMLMDDTLSEKLQHEMKIYFGAEIDELVEGKKTTHPLHEKIFGNHNELKTLYENGLKLLK